MRHLSVGAMAVATLAAIAPVAAQVPPSGPPPAQRPAPYVAPRLPFPGMSPDDAYREGLINRWELERYTGPTPQALQGPSVNGSKGMQQGGGM